MAGHAADCFFVLSAIHHGFDTFLTQLGVTINTKTNGYPLLNIYEKGLKTMTFEFIKKHKIKPLRVARRLVQGVGIAITALGFFVGYPMINLVLLGVTLLMGPFFCGWLCPFGTLQDLFGRLGRLFGFKKQPMPRLLGRFLVFSRYILLANAMLISTDLIFSLLSLDPRNNLASALQRIPLASFGWSVVAGILVIAVFFERPFCNYLCIEGARLGLISALRPVTIRKNVDVCCECKCCDRACPMNIIISQSDQVRSLQCINCMECVLACPVEGGLTVGFVPLKKTGQRIGVVLGASALLILGVFAWTNRALALDLVQGNFSAASSAEPDFAVLLAESDIDIGDAAGIADGVYTGSGTGFRGLITVDVTVKDEKIVRVEVVQHTEDARWYTRAYNTVASAVIANQTADVDIATGATYSSVGIKQAVANALIAAGAQDVAPIENTLPEKSPLQPGGGLGGGHGRGAGRLR